MTQTPLGELLALAEEGAAQAVPSDNRSIDNLIAQLEETQELMVVYGLTEYRLSRWDSENANSIRVHWRVVEDDGGGLWTELNDGWSTSAVDTTDADCTCSECLAPLSVKDRAERIRRDARRRAVTPRDLRVVQAKAVLSAIFAGRQLWALTCGATIDSTTTEP